MLLLGLLAVLALLLWLGILDGARYARRQEERDAERHRRQTGGGLRAAVLWPEPEHLPDDEVQDVESHLAPGVLAALGGGAR